MIHNINPIFEWIDKVTGKEYGILGGQKAIRDRSKVLRAARQKGYLTLRQAELGAKTSTLRNAAQKVMAEDPSLLR